MSRYWVIAPFAATSPNDFDRVWSHDLEQGIISIGWEAEGPINEKTLEEVNLLVRQVRPHYSETQATRVANMLWQFHNEVSPGDIVIARRGRKMIAAVGEVEASAEFISDNPPRAQGVDYDHNRILKVRWRSEDRELALPEIVFGMKTIYEIDKEKFETLVGGDTANTEIEGSAEAENVSDFRVPSKEMSYDLPLSATAQRLLDALPPDGSVAGNIRLRADLRLVKAEYNDAKTELLRKKQIILGSGKGGSIRRAKAVSKSEGDYYKKSAIAQLNNNKRNGHDQPVSNNVKEEIDLGTDELFIEEDSSDEEASEFEAANSRLIFSDKSDPSVSDVYIRFKEGELVLQPDFQRQFIWDAKKSSKLIESAILEVPLPMIYLAEELDGRESVIDGQQRLTAFINFLDGGYSLTGLTVLKELNGCNFGSLDREHQNRIKRCAIRTTTIKKESSENLKFEIFERLNTGAISLNDQELRNCIYRGRYNDLLKELSRDAEFKNLIGIKKIERRMRDVELVLRFAAFYHASYLNYTSPMRRFLNMDMIKYQNICEADKKKLIGAFKNAIQITKSVFGRHAFRRFYKGNRGNPDGVWEARTFSASIYDVVMYSFARVDKHSVYRHLDEIREAFLYCMTADDSFIETIERGTSNKVMITKRFDIWRRHLDEILGSSIHDNPRFFSYELKQQLFDKDNTCRICGQRIHTIDDAAVDHIEQYWRGGLTIPPNARLTHRYCNWERSKND